MNRRHETMLSAAFALWGLAIAIALITVFDRPAPADQLPGLARTLGFDAHGPFRWIAGLMLLPILVPLVLRPVARRLAEGAAWARNAAMIAPLVALWLVTVRHDVRWTIIPCALAIALCTLFRHRPLQFTRRDIVLIPTFQTALLGIMDIAASLPTDAAVYIAALLVLSLRIAVSFVGSPLPPALSFVAAPLGLVLQTGFFARDQRYFGWHAVAIVVITPFVLRFVLKDAWRAIAILTFAIYPIALYSYSNAVSTTTAEGRSRVNFFEDGHALLPASEYLRGELPYQDILPAHGLFEDGYFDYLVMRAGDVNIGTRAKAREVAGNFVCVAVYFLALAATGSAEGAFLAVLLSFLMGVYRGHLRLVAPILTLACIAAGVRLRKWRWFALAGFGSVVCGVVSLDFAAYTFLTLVVAVVRNGRALRPALAGLACGVLPLLVIFAASGILDDFVRGTFVETLAVGPAYTLNFFTPPAPLAKHRAFPDVLAALLERDSFLYLFWCGAAIFVGVTVTRRVSRRLEPVVLIGVWIVATAISYAERHHLYFGMVAAVVIVYAVQRLLRVQRALAAAAIVALMAMAGPTVHIGIVGWMRHARGPLDPSWVEIRDLPRASGAYFHEKDAAFVASVRKYVSLSLAPGQTFFDFTNSGILYFLLRRDFPIRHYEVAFYQSEALQREVIRRIEANPNVQAALVPATPAGRFTIDGVPNAERAPLVWQYLQTHFYPDFVEGEVVFWRRR